MLIFFTCLVGFYQSALFRSKNVVLVPSQSEISELYITSTEGLTWSTYRPPFVGKHGKALQRSFLYNLPPLSPATLRPRRGRTQKSPPCRDNKLLQSSVSQHLFGSADCHRVFPKSCYVGLGMARYVLLQKHLVIIPFIVFIPDDTALAWNRPQ